jgi:uncharacterized integral membrane protein
MRWFNSLLGLALFAFVFWFAVRNSGSVPISLWGDLHWDDVPLVLVIVGCVALGMVFGALAMLPHVVRARQQQAEERASHRRRSTVPQGTIDRHGERLADAARNAGAGGDLGA